MSVISLLVEFLTILCLPVMAGQALANQGDKDDLQKIAGKYYNLEALMMSDDGRWLAISKSYDLNSDTILIFNSKNTEQPVAVRVKAENLAFLGDNYLLMQNTQQVELLNLREQTSLFLNNVKQVKAINGNRMFIVLYNNDEQDKLELRDSHGRTLNIIKNVSSYYTSMEDNVFAVVEDASKSSKLVRLNSVSTDTVYKSSQKITRLDTHQGNLGLIIYEQNQVNNSQEVVYLDLGNRIVYSLKELLPISIQRGFSEVIKDGDLYFLILQIESPKTESSIVDIWYSNDSKLEKKFYSSAKELYYLWEPKKKNVKQIGNDRLTSCINLKNEYYFLCYDPYSLQNYTKCRSQLKLYTYNGIRDCFSVLDTIDNDFFISANGEWALSQKNKHWFLYNIPTGNKEMIDGVGFKKPWFTNDGKAILFEGEGALWRYEIKTRKLIEAAVFKDYQTTIVNGVHIGLNAVNGVFSRNIVDVDKPFVVRLYNPQDNLTSYVLLKGTKSEIIVPPTRLNIQYLNYNKTYDWFSWVEENYNKPPYLVYKEVGAKEKILYQSNINDKSVLSLKQEIFSYSNSEGIPLTGILYYPLNYNPLVKYPMIVRIYKIQKRSESNIYPVVSYGSPFSVGFNLRIFLENGYFVYFPDIEYGGNGPGLSALNCIDNALDALKSNPSIDQNKIGLIGHSHGGYETNFIATHSDRFAAYVSGAGNSDIVRSYFSFNYNFLSPFYWQYEDGQYDMKKSFSENKNLYFVNNPIYYVDQVTAPILLWAGMKDQNIYWEQTMEFYIALKRNSKKAVALFYPDEGHAIIAEDACKDLVSRVLDWFDYFLKGESNVSWIDKEIKEDAL